MDQPNKIGLQHFHGSPKKGEPNFYNPPKIYFGDNHQQLLGFLIIIPIIGIMSVIISFILEIIVM